MAFGANTISSFAGGVSDFFAGEGHRAKAEGDRIEAENYLLASKFATQNVGFTEQATALKESQLDRQIYQTIGGERAQIAGAGLTQGGSGFYLLADSASQGALTKSVAATQGLITEEGYKEQAQSYENMAKAAKLAADAEDQAALGADITGGLKMAASIATLFT
ncbi:hypothetical protein [Bradyrhizobium sp. SZCCHNRI1073]|uniref:hypothetical protein n=1 Tax=Bradyrhizobium sp. SZCCHNRI1073 TaxID=3057280 RepID=UPI00291665C1|nr:hypothetical protein [Bradyrhizobium sp. SZCCHNRI1073]